MVQRGSLLLSLLCAISVRELAVMDDRRSRDALCFPGGALGDILGRIMRVMRELYLMQQHQGDVASGERAALGVGFLPFFNGSFGFF